MRTLKALSSIVLVQGLGAGLSLIFFLILTKLLGAEEFGKYVWVISISGIIALLVQLGLPTSIVKKFAPLSLYKITAPSALANTFSIYVLLSIVSCITLLCILPYINDFTRYEIAWAVPIGTSLACLAISDAILRSANLGIKAQIASQLIRNLFLIIGVLLLVLFNNSNVDIYLFLYSATALLSAIVFLTPLLTLVIKNISVSSGGKVVGSNTSHFQVAMSRSIGNHLPIFITGFFVSPEVLAYLAIAMRLTAPIIFGVSASRAYFGAKINKSIKTSQYSDAYKDYNSAAIFSLVIAMIGALFIITITAFLITFDYGLFENFSDGEFLIIILCLVSVFRISLAAFGPVQLVAILLNCEKFVRNYNLVMLATLTIGLLIAGIFENIAITATIMLLYGFFVSFGLWLKIKSIFKKHHNL
ncbi:lipopolysaccharide biosynthesis protein [Cobetia amphilecti]|uniref:lipopolysaccharide biosynthesis protein n=1 Tax=Cobetia amphilecti TaxID=1055104 RepID=UPI001C096AFB|nr:oligosaccharide flippase family protein [Cobetia amphilecti]MBU3007657.1 oligosaccharide flippase family protein [Cobetia amphilecti]